MVGAGYVGLPTAALFADAGFNVTAIDLQPSIVESVNRCDSPIDEPGLKELICRNVLSGRLRAVLTCDAELTREDAIIVTVQTPVDENNTPDINFLMNALDFVGNALRENSLVAICSTVPPGTLSTKVKPLLEFKSDLTADKDFFLAYVPERIAPGKSLKEFVESPRIVGGIGPNSTAVIGDLFSAVCSKMIRTDSATAEIVKTAENTFRDVNIAFANQLALICEKHGTDVMNAIELANTHPRVNIHLPGPGVGGPCLVKDPYLLIHGINFENDVITAARAVNDSMPKHVVELTLKGLSVAGKQPEKSRIAFLGTAYKANVDDARYSPSQQVITELTRHVAATVVYDPYCPATFGAKKASCLTEAVQDADCLVLLVDHADFKKLDCAKIKSLMNPNPVIIDGKRLVASQTAKENGFTYFGVGCCPV
ncbi:MAG: nucleotide sugar dehydrogenase [Candidatus Bathyarchaeota archaeon]|nr:nucleotide sugar dehydrogenase [Candidatus Bathyarchaeota archaeon]